MCWSSTKLSIKRCTCVNKRKKSRSRWTLRKNIDRVPTAVSLLIQECHSDNQLTEGWALSDPWLSNPAKMKKCCYGQEKNLGQYSSPSLSPLIPQTQQNINLSKINCERLIFCKEVYSFVYWIHHYQLIMFLHIFAQIYNKYICTNIQIIQHV